MKSMIKQHKSRTKLKPKPGVEIYSPYGNIHSELDKPRNLGPRENEFNLTNDSYQLVTMKNYDGRFGNSGKQEISPATRTFMEGGNLGQGHPGQKKVEPESILLQEQIKDWSYWKENVNPNRNQHPIPTDLSYSENLEHLHEKLVLLNKEKLILEKKSQVQRKQLEEMTQQVWEGRKEIENLQGEFRLEQEG